MTEALTPKFRREIPEGDHLERSVCDHCNFIDYHNPRVVVGAVPIFENKVLLARRAIEPRKGLWTVPGGFMEKGESLQDGAARETWEECGAKIDVGPLLGMFTVPHISQVQ
ncbi:MAG: NUDIX domain-containing protein, partial [Alphaproteobacteria bacterium]